MPVRRYDRSELRSKPETTAQGYLRADAALTRTGVFDYRRPDGSIRRELRLPEDVFHADSMKSYSLAPLTNDHPPEMLTPENTKKFQVGTLGSEARRDGALVAGQVLFTDATAIDDVKAGKVELSCGYDCDLDEKPGVHNGERYDAIQRNIVINHVALVARGRAGSTVRVRLDAGDAEQVEPISTTLPREDHMRKIRIDGVEYEVSEQVAQAFEKNEKARLDSIAAKDAEIAAKAKLVDEHSRSATEAKKLADTEKARADSADSAAKTAEKARLDAVDPKHIDGLVKSRTALLTRATAVLGSEASSKLDSADEKAIRAAIVGKLVPDVKLDGQSDDYARAIFDIEMKRFDAANPAADKLARASAGIDDKGNRTDAVEPRKDAREEFIKDSEQAYRRPLAHTTEKERARK
jgi:hypothetical protein